MNFSKIPSTIKEIGDKLNNKNFEAFLVGGCVRDLIRQKNPTDWDITTNAKPEEIQKIFKDSFYKNNFGTVSVKSKEKDIKNIEITTYRTEGEYSNYRHPSQVFFSNNIKEDLKRRDFTVNAIAVDLESLGKSSPQIIDLYKGQVDLKKKIIRAVGLPDDRFNEDALRLIRAIRFAIQLNFKIEKKTLEAIKKKSFLLAKISKERIRDEFIKIIRSENPARGIEMLKENKLLSYILPELEKGVGVNQNLHHIYTVYEHLLMSLRHCPSRKLSVRLAALLHDIAKPQTKKGKGANSTFYNHDIIGASIAYKALLRLRFSHKIAKKVSLLIRNHMFYYEVETVTPASVRRLIRKVGLENINDLINLRIADRLGSGCPKAKPYKLRHLEYLVEKVSQDPISVKMLKVDGNKLKEKAKIKPGPKMGIILDILLGEVLKDTTKNKESYLIKRARDLDQKDLTLLKEQAKEKIEDKKIEEDRILKRKYWVK
jgi:tRNA nucleotidyltransferase (CCA-adding enzyme)